MRLAYAGNSPYRGPAVISSGGTQPAVNRYFTSTEPGGDGSDPGVAFATNFMRPDGSGKWYDYDFDTANANGGFTNASVISATQGWGGTIYANPVTPAGAVANVACRSATWSATSGYLDGGIGGRNMADHDFYGQLEYEEVWFRVFFKWSSDYVGSHEKMFDLTRGGLGANQLLALSFNYFGSNQIKFIPYLHQDDGLPGSPVGGAWMGANLTADITCSVGRWYAYEMHVKLNTPGVYDGVFEFWMDDMGTDGYGGPAVNLTKRGAYTNVLYRNNTTEAGVKISGVWIENWANNGTSGSVGTEYYNWVMVRTDHACGVPQGV